MPDYDKSPFWSMGKAICVAGWAGFGIFSAIMTAKTGDSCGYGASVICGIIAFVALLIPD